ncbi:MAG: sigma-70 family RNA polymerase sigma factor [Acidobacteria bacterium]|nr:sigma-70 family RNA polymerase sigma factor [Acidobacteriota bacterium]
MPTHLENEGVLVRRAQAGDHEAFAMLVRQYERHIYRLALNITKDPTDAEDVLQEAFLKAYSNLQSFQGDSRFYTWLVRIAVNEALMKLRKQRAAPVMVALDEPITDGEGQEIRRDLADWGDNPEQRFGKVELGEILSAAIESLELPYRMVVMLRDIEELSTEETAKALELSVPAVKSRLLRARLMLRNKLSRHFNKAKHA